MPLFDWRPAPSLGSAMHTLMRMQVANGQAALLTLTPLDFLPGDTRLSYRGWHRLRRMAACLQRDPFPMVPQPTPGRPDLDEQRRMAVLAELERFGLAISVERIVVADPRARGLDGPDAEVLNQKLLGLTAGGSGAGQRPPAAQQLVLPAP